MTTDPDALVRTFLDRCAAGDLHAALALCHEDLEYDNVPIPTIHGVVAAREFLATMFGPGVRAEWEVHAQVAQGHLVMNERTDRFWYPDGRHVALPVAGVFEVHDGRITRWRDFFDLRTFEQQLAGGTTSEGPEGSDGSDGENEGDEGDA